MMDMSILEEWGIIRVNDDRQWWFEASESTKGVFHDDHVSETLAHLSHEFHPGTYYFRIQLEVRNLSEKVENNA